MVELHRIGCTSTSLHKEYTLSPDVIMASNFCVRPGALKIFLCPPSHAHLASTFTRADTINTTELYVQYNTYNVLLSLKRYPVFQRAPVCCF